jgi:predicted membrane protein
MKNETYNNIIYFCFFIFILTLTPILSKKYFEVFKNSIFQVMSIILIILVSLYNKNLAVIILMAYAISYSYAIITSYNKSIFEKFVSDDILEVPEQEDKFEPTDKIINAEVLWSSNYLGRELGLNK